MISIHLTVDLRCVANLSNHGVVRSAQVSVKKSKRVPTLCASLRVHPLCSSNFFSLEHRCGWPALGMVLLSGQWRSHSKQLERPTINVSKPCFQRPEFAIRGQRSLVSNSLGHLYGDSKALVALFLNSKRNDLIITQCYVVRMLSVGMCMGFC